MKNYAVIICFLFLASNAQAIDGPGGENTFCVWRSSAMNETHLTSLGMSDTMIDWGYDENDFSEIAYGGWIMVGVVVISIPPSVCRLPDFVTQLQTSHAAMLIASHANSTAIAVEVYFDEFGANLAKYNYETFGGYSNLSVVILPQGWGLCVNDSFISNVQPNVKIIFDAGCENCSRNNWWSSANHIVGYHGSLGPGDLYMPIINFFRMLHYNFDIDSVYDSFPVNYQYSFAEAAQKNDVLCMWKGGEVALGPTFVPFLHKHYERDGPGLLDIYFDLNMPCSGTFQVSSFNSEVATVAGTGFVGGQGDMYVTVYITGAGISVLQCYSHNINSPNTPGIMFNGGIGFSVKFAADTTPNANIEHFSVVNGTALIRIGGKNNTKRLLVEGSNQEAGLYEEIISLPVDELMLGLNSVHNLPVFNFYRLQELEESGNIIRHGVTSMASEEATPRSECVSTDKVAQALASILQGPAAARLVTDKLAIMVPNSLANPVEYYQSFWQWRGVQTEVFLTDYLWGDTTNAHIFRANHKILMNNLIAQGYKAFLLIGDASDNYELLTPWPVEHGWELKRQELLNGGYIPQPDKNILPSPVVWYDPVLPQESGTNLPYFFTDWLLLDADCDNWPDHDLVIGRLPFSEEWQVWNYLSKLFDYAEYGLPNTPINTLMLLGDVNHFGEFDGDHAVSVMADHDERVTWQKFNMAESQYPSDFSRAMALRNAWQDDNQRWNFVVSVASYSTRYKLGNFVNLAFDLNTVTPSMTHHPFMFLNTCTTGNYWWTENGGVKPRMEYLLEHPRGVIGLFAHSDGSWQEQNRELGKQFTEILAQQAHESWGAIAAKSVEELKDTGYRTRVNTLRTVFLGDPLIEPRAHNPNPHIPTSVPQVLSTGLRGNLPNPFNPVTKISYDLAHDSEVELSVYDLRGRQVAILVKGHMRAGHHHALWAGTESGGRDLPSGMYLCRLNVNQHTSTHKLMLVK